KSGRLQRRDGVALPPFARSGRVPAGPAAKPADMTTSGPDWRVKDRTSPLAATMISRRAAASAGRNSLSTARWRWRGRVGRTATPADGSGTGSPAMATSMARMRFSAVRLIAIARFQSIAASSHGGGILGWAFLVGILRSTGRQRRQKPRQQQRLSIHLLKGISTLMSSKTPTNLLFSRRNLDL